MTQVVQGMWALGQGSPLALPWPFSLHGSGGEPLQQAAQTHTAPSHGKVEPLYEAPGEAARMARPDRSPVGMTWKNSWLTMKSFLLLVRA